MTAQQIRWAAQHDWFVSGGNGQVAARDFTRNDAGAWVPHVVYFTNFAELRSWAGY